MDGQRVYPINQFVIHHTGTNDTDFVGWSDLDIQDWFDRVGKQHGYDPAGVSRSYHLHPQRDKETFAQYQIALVPNGNADDPNVDWRVINLMQEIWDNVAWGAGNWPVNQQGINVCVAGNRVGRPLNKKALYRLAEFWQPQDSKLNGLTYVNPHRAVSQTATACPGAVAEQIDTVIRYINDLPAAKKEAFPPLEFDGPLNNRSMRFVMKRPIHLFNFLTLDNIKLSDPTIDIVASTNIINGETWYIPQDRIANLKNEPFGYRESDLFNPNYQVKLIEPIPQESKDVWEVRANQTVVIYTGNSEDEATKAYTSTEVSATYRVIQLLKNNIATQTKIYEEPKTLYTVYSGLVKIHEGYDKDVAQQVYNTTQPTSSTKMVVIWADDVILESKEYKAPEEPEKEQSLLDWILQLLEQFAAWLKGWKK